MEKSDRKYVPAALYAALVTLCLSGSVAAAQEAAREATGAPARDAEVAGAARMRALLAEIRSQAPERNPYLGTRRLELLRARLDGLGADTPAFDRGRLLYQIGRLELNRGDTREAIGRLEESRTLLGEAAGEDRIPWRVLATYDLAVAYLRLGETENCVAHHGAESCILPITGGGLHRRPEGSQKALALLRELFDELPAVPLRLAVRWLANIAAMTLGEYPDGLDESLRIPERSFTSRVEFPRFADVAGRVGLATMGLAGGVVFDDLDGDGALDVLTSSWDPEADLRFLANDGRGGFVDRTEAAGLAGLMGGLNLIQGDYDGDGDLDVLVLRGGWLRGEYGRQPKSLLRNDGTGRFTDVTFSSGLGEVHYPTQTAAWADYDGDGDLDLFVGNEATAEDRYPCQLFQNRGDGTFVDVARAAGVENFRYAKGVAWGDYDADGDPDLYVSNYGSKNRLYRNAGDGSFAQVAGEAGVTGPLFSFPTWFWDYDGDGVLDLYVGSYYQSFEGSRLAALVASELGLPHEGELAKLYRGNGRGGFEDVGERAGLDLLTVTMGANHGDLDNDGFLDFYLGTGYPVLDGLVPNVMYRNRNGEGFDDVTMAGGFGHLQKGHGVAFVDWDQDGDEDVFEVMGGAFPTDVAADVLFENPGFGNHWIKVRLQGRRANSFGIGAHLRFDLEVDGRRRSVHRWVGSGGSFGCGPVTEQHVGLGTASRVGVLEVVWPGSATRQRFENLDADRGYVLVEGVDEPAPLPLHRPRER